MNRERFVKPKIDKYIQLYSKKAKVEEAVQTISLIGTIDIENGGQQYPSNQTATISAPSSGFSYPPTARRAILTASCNDQGHVNAVGIIDGGAGYISAPTISVVSITPFSQDVLAVITPLITNGVITSVTITQQGTYDSRQVVVSVSEPNTTDIATGTCTIDADGRINSVTIANAGLNYTTAPQISVSGLGVASLTAYLKQGFGGNLSLNYQYNPTIAYKYYWELDTPLELNENGLLQLVHREFYNVPTNDKGKLIVIRMHDISTKSIVNTKNTGINADFNSGIIIDIGKEDRLLPNEILLEINPQTIDRITLSLNHDISGFAGFHYQIEFLLILKVIEKEPSYLEYGTLNNII